MWLNPLELFSIYVSQDILNECCAKNTVVSDTGKLLLQLVQLNYQISGACSSKDPAQSSFQHTLNSSVQPATDSRSTRGTLRWELPGEESMAEQGQRNWEYGLKGIILLVAQNWVFNWFSSCSFRRAGKQQTGCWTNSKSIPFSCSLSRGKHFEI